MGRHSQYQKEPQFMPKDGGFGVSKTLLFVNF